MNKSESIKNLAAALSKFQAEVKPIKKDGKANYGKFATLGNIVESIRKELTDNGLSVSQLGYSSVQPDNELVQGILLETVIMHSSGEFISGTSFVPLDKVTPQGFGAAMTYAKRYALSAALGIVADDDDDAQSVEPSGSNGAQTSSAKSHFRRG